MITTIKPLPDWMGKECVPENRETTIELLTIWAALLDVGGPIDPTNLSDTGWVKWACIEADALQKITDAKIPKREDGITGVWVGFPDTPIGRLNGKLVGAVFFVWRWRMHQEHEKD